jgi:hypothetical protein
MSRWKPILAALVTAFVANLVGVLLFFKPIADGDTGRFEINPAAGLFTYVVLCVALFDWTARQIESAYKAAFIVAGSQLILVIDLMLRGERGLATAAAGAVLLAVTWVPIAYVYTRLGGTKSIGRGNPE